MQDYLGQSFDLDAPAFIAAFDELPFWSARFGALLFRHLEIRRDLDVLDVGCGTGFPLFELANVHGRACRVTGVDRWRAALVRAREKRSAYGMEWVDLVEADAARLPFADRSFDLLVSNLGLNNFEAPEVVVAECARVARPGARLVITTNPQGLMREVYQCFREVLVHDDDRARLAANEAHRGNAAEITALLEGGGFSVARLIADQFSYRFASGAALLRHYLVRVGFLPSWRAAIDPQRVEATFAALEARLDRWVAEHGELEATVPMLYLEAVRV